MMPDLNAPLILAFTVMATECGLFMINPTRVPLSVQISADIRRGIRSLLFHGTEVATYGYPYGYPHDNENIRTDIREQKLRMF